MDEETSKMLRIIKLASLSQDLLYSHSDEKMNSFMDPIENLLIVETFLFM
jgi:hypothetical protein